VAAALAALRTRERRSVRIVDADCGAGTLLLCAVRLARRLGFTSIEARGIDHAPASIARARAAAAVMHDPAIGITFETADLVAALDDESEFPADILVWHGCAKGCDAAVENAVEHAVACAGRTLIADTAHAASTAA
jgi:SAM-dependent methyltransferase